MTSDQNYQLHLGWDPEGKPLLIDFDNLLRHTAILAQSGAGKSVLVGRLVEEILIKTDARLVVLDANGDFRNAHILADPTAEVWSDTNQPPNDSFDYTEFAERWQRLSMFYVTNGSDHNRSELREWATPYVSWEHLPIQSKMEILGLEMGRDPEEAALLHVAEQSFPSGGPDGLPISPNLVSRELERIALNRAFTDRIDDNAIASLRMRLQQAATLGIWREVESQPDVSRCISEKRRLLVIDLPSLGQSKSKLILAAQLLEDLWRQVGQEWDDVARTGIDHRVPTFVVVDEAHNFVPERDPDDPVLMRISQTIQRIAAEGRKYGLFVLLATQRPPKVSRGLLSECENACFLRMQSPKDLEILAQIWSVIDDDRVWVRKETKRKGQGLLVGPWAKEYGQKFRGGRRRTKETGGNLSVGWIHKRT